MWTDKLTQELLEQKNGRFKSWNLKRRVGSGYSGVVFEAVDDFGGSLAIKVYDPEFRAEDKRSAKPEHFVRLSRQLRLRGHDCPYLVGIVDGGEWGSETESYYYITMPFVDGISLSNYLHRPPRSRVAPLVAQIATAVEYLEGRGIVHRDIKPSNIMLSRDYRRATLLDTGVVGDIENATLPSSSAASESNFKGTFAYAPPEYITNEHKQDKGGWKAISLYQLGAVIYELLYGRKIYADINNRFQLAKQKEMGPPEMPALPDEDEALSYLRSLALRCLAPKPQERLDKVDWSAFSCERQKRKPTIVFLYAGGTIGSHNSEETGHSPNEIATNENDYLKEVSDRVLKEYSLIFQRGDSPPFDLLWRTVPPKFQILSENSNSQVLGALADAVSDILTEFSGAQGTSKGSFAGTNEPVPGAMQRYLLGVVILHGTDTLAYTAAALHFALPRLPCPVVITGSNVPPDHRDSPVAASLVAPRSDAWKNLSRSIHFITSLGHRFSEVFVYFAGTVLHALNVKKVKTSSVPLREEIATRLVAEPFVFRNASTFRSIAFKFIDGSFCNNFYPVAGTVEYTFKRLTGTDAGSDSITPHARAWPGVSFEKPVYRFDPSVQQATAALCPTHSELEECKVLLLEGYASGTFGSDHRHNFHKTLAELFRRSIPLVIVSADGIFPMQEQYRTEPLEDGRPFPCITLYRTLPATAFPLLSLILGELREEEWTPGKASPRELLEYRNDLLKARIADKMKSTVIASSVLGNVSRQREQERRVELFRSSEDNRFEQTIDELFRFEANAEQSLTLRAARNRDRWNLSMRKGDLLGLLYLQAQPYSAMGSMPDMFSNLSYIGFTWARTWARGIARALVDDHNRASGRLLRHVDIAEYKARCQSAARLVSRLGKILHVYGWGIECELKIEERSAYTITAKVHGRLILQREDELYGVYNWRRRDELFLSEIQKGIPLEEDDRYFASRLKELYDYDFARQFSPYEWILVGMLRCLSCEVGRVLRIDNWTMECFEARAFESLRTSRELKATINHPDILDLNIEYVARRD